MSQKKIPKSSIGRPKGSEIWRKDRAHVIHPYTDFATFQDEGSHVISSASGCYVTDIEGNEYLDAIAGLWCSNIGHGRLDMAEAIADQVAKNNVQSIVTHCQIELLGAVELITHMFLLE